MEVEAEAEVEVEAVMVDLGDLGVVAMEVSVEEEEAILVVICSSFQS